MEPSADLAKIMGPLLVAEDGSAGPSTSQASLFLARDLTGREVVLKRTTARSREQLDSAQNEVSLLRKIRHPNVVGFCGVWTRPLQPYGTEVNLLIELCPGGHLLELRRRREEAGRPLTEQEIVRLFVQCCRGVECLHRFDPPVAHRDVKLENLLLGGEDGRIVKLCDFGSATTRRTLVTTKEERARLEEEVLRLTTPSYRAPELVDLYSRKLVSEHVDVWALGCVLYALAFGKHAFGEEGSVLAILGCKFTVPPEPYYSDEIKLLFFWLLDGDPNLRPRIGDVVDELDMLLWNKIKIPAERRGSGCGARSVTRFQQMHDALKPPTPKTASVPPPPIPRRQGPSPGSVTTAVPVTTARGASFFPSNGGNTSPSGSNDRSRTGRSSAMESRRAHQGNKPLPSPLLAASATKQPQQSPKASKPMVSNNPFDDLPPSMNPTFFSTPGMRSTSVAGFPDEFLQADLGTPFDPPAEAFAKAQSQVSFFSFGTSQSTHALNPVTHVASSHNFGAVPPSQAPVFFSDPPPQWRSSSGM